MGVLAYVHAAGSKSRQHCFQRAELISGAMAAIVDDRVDGAAFCQKTLPEGAVPLVTDYHRDPLALVHFASRLDIDPRDPRSGTQIFTPHRQTSAAEHPDLDQVYLSTTKAMKMTFVDRKVVPPLRDPRSPSVGVKVPFEVTGRRWVPAS